MSGVPRSRAAALLDAALATLAGLVLLGALVTLAQRPELRVRIDATRTRAYALSEQTERLLRDLKGSWTVALLMTRDGADTTVRAQVDEVLRRFERTAPDLTVRRIDPEDPRSIADYEALVAQLRRLEVPRLAPMEAAIADGLSAFHELLVFAQQEAGQLEQAGQLLPADDRDAAALAERTAVLALLAAEGGRVVDLVEEARRANASRPIPDHETARSALLPALQRYADELVAAVGVLDGWAGRTELDPALRRFGAQSAERCETLAARLVQAAEPLATLPPPELGAIGAALERGETAVVIGPDRAAIIPPEQLFPALPAGGERFDRRFRGEQVVAAAIRSLLVERMPYVVLVHAEERTLLKANEGRADLVGAASLLDASRFQVAEWAVGSTERPVPPRDAAAVWIVVPPLRREGLEPSARELRLVDALRDLLASGEPVLVGVYPSLLPRYRRPDPWAQTLAAAGLEARTDAVVYEGVDAGEGRVALQQGVAIDRFDATNPIGRAAEGQQTFLVFPVALEARADAGVPWRTIASVPPSPRRWLEKDWHVRSGIADRLDVPQPLDAPVPVIAALERATGEGVQRVLAVGSGGWLLSYVLDAVTTLGDGRAALVNPGNQELLLASVQWLAGMDDLIAPSPIARQTARLEGLDGPARSFWIVTAVVVLPLGCLAIALVVTLRRRAA